MQEETYPKYVLRADLSKYPESVEKDLKAQLAENVRYYRNARKWTQERLAEAADLSFPMIQKIETGKTWPSPETIEKLVKALGASRESLLTGQVPSKKRFALSGVPILITHSERRIEGPGRDEFDLYEAIENQNRKMNKEILHLKHSINAWVQRWQELSNENRLLKKNVPHEPPNSPPEIPQDIYDRLQTADDFELEAVRAILQIRKPKVDKGQEDAG